MSDGSVCDYGDIQWCLHKGDQYVDITGPACLKRHLLCLECSGERFEEI